MFLNKVKVEAVAVSNKDGKTGTTTYRIYGYAGSERFRLALGTEKAGTADTRQGWIEQAVREGASSTLWPTLKDALPRRSFEFFANLVAYKHIPKVADERTWAELRAEYSKHLNRPIESGKRAGRLRTQSTKNRYHEVMNMFGTFLAEKKITLLADITEHVARVQFQDWRVADIRSKSNSRPSSNPTKLPGGYVLDVAILCGVFKFAAQNGMIAKTPFRYCGKPGEDAENGAMPFSAKELSALIKHAKGDLLALLVLLRTGLRRSDAVRLQWKHVGPTHVSITATKNGSKVRVPIQTDLAAVLEQARRDRYPTLEPDDYAEDFVLINPATKQPFHTGQKLYERMLRIGQRAGVVRVHPHRFRDSFAKVAFLNGATIDEVAAWLGDKSETVSAHYGFMDEERRKVADEKLLRGTGLVDATEIVAQQALIAARPKVRTLPSRAA